MGSLSKQIKKSAILVAAATTTTEESGPDYLAEPFDLTEKINEVLNKQAERVRKNRNKNKALRRARK